MKRFLSTFLCVAITAVSVVPAMSQRSVDQGLKYVPGELIVQMKAGTAFGDVERVAGKANAFGLEKIRDAGADLYGRGDLVLMRFSQLSSVAEMKSAVADDPLVEFAEPNWIYEHQATSNDTYYTGGNLWGMYGDATSPANQFGSQAGEAWAAGKTNCSSVYIGIIDEGYMYTHEDLAANAG